MKFMFATQYQALWFACSHTSQQERDHLRGARAQFAFPIELRHLRHPEQPVEHPRHAFAGDDQRSARQVRRQRGERRGRDERECGQP